MKPHVYMLINLGVLFIIFSVFTVAAKAQDFVGAVRYALERNSPDQASQLLEAYRASRGITPEYVLAYSWLGRSALANKQYAEALHDADETYTMSADLLKSRKLDDEPNLPTALGAAIEVKGLALAQSGKAVEARKYLNAELVKYRGTSMAPRIQKNINLLGLTGAPAPALKLEPHLGTTPQPWAALKGKPVVIFLWAHWCVDCKAEAPILGRLKREYGDNLAVIGPTQLFGYAAEGRNASPHEEMQYIDAVRKKYFSVIGDMAVPVAAENFQRYGASTSPTLVIVGPDGKVALYHPGRMTYDELKTELDRLVPKG